ncbi:MAG TPA: hypothetical protein VFT74_18235, partial [Isosphaeraceae bacterium]|nr:hypothetical protein [Isosphaeraceae bacterium]
MKRREKGERSSSVTPIKPAVKLGREMGGCEALPGRTTVPGGGARVRPISRQPHVALIVETSSAYGRQILQGIARYLRAHQAWSVFLEQRALTTQVPSWLHDWKGDGVIVRNLDGELAEMLERSHVPVVDLMDRGGDSTFPVIRSNDEAIGRLG